MHNLALALGKTMDEILDTMSAKELALWEVYASVYPLGPERDELNAALIASTAANMVASDPISPVDMVPDWGGVRSQRKAREKRVTKKAAGERAKKDAAALQQAKQRSLGN